MAGEMRKAVGVVLLAGLCAAAARLASEEGGEAIYKADFEKEKAGTEASALGFVVIGEGDFRVKLDGQNKVLELAPYPLDSHGFLFGPAETGNAEAQVRVCAAAAGRRFPVFAVGLSGVGGYLLRLQPVRKVLELLKADEVKAAVPCTWTSGTWTVLAVSVRRVKDGAWTVRGKAWEYGKEEPKDWQLSFDDTEKPPPGRAGVWGIPYSGEPIRFDDLTVRKAR